MVFIYKEGDKVLCYSAFCKPVGLLTESPSSIFHLASPLTFAKFHDEYVAFAFLGDGPGLALYRLAFLDYLEEMENKGMDIDSLTLRNNLAMRAYSYYQKADALEINEEDRVAAMDRVAVMRKGAFYDISPWKAVDEPVLFPIDNINGLAVMDELESQGYKGFELLDKASRVLGGDSKYIDPSIIRLYYEVGSDSFLYKEGDKEPVSMPVEDFLCQ